MAEFIRTEEKVVNVGEPVIFENNTDSDFSVSAAIVFRKSGLYDVSIVGRRTIISKVTERKKGEWKVEEWTGDFYYECSECKEVFRLFDETLQDLYNFCPNCGADMRGEQNE